MATLPAKPQYAAGAWALAVLMTVIAAARIVSTYDVFNQTSDEPFHIAAGMELLDRGVYSYEAQHPPLARVATAIGPYMLGRRSQGETDGRSEGKAILLGGGDPIRNLAAARSGILPFFVVATLVVWLWAKRLGGLFAALVAVLLFTTLPPVLAHSGLATNDAAVMAFVAAGVWAFARWLESPRIGSAALVGACWSLAILSKLSALLYLPVSAVAALALWGIGRHTGRLDANRVSPSVIVKHGLVAGLVGFGLIWSCYRWSVTFPSKLGGLVPVPAFELFRGVQALFEHNASGHLAYLLGETSQTGWWYFFPVAIAVKTPLPFLFLTLIGAWVSLRKAYRDRDWSLPIPIVTSVAILLAVMPININIGLRYILPIFPALSVVGGTGAVALWNNSTLRPVARVSLVALLAWLVIDTTRAHPDYLAYFNETVRQRANPVLIDSDLDWGQDFYRLVAEVERRRIDNIAVAFWGSVDFVKQGARGMRKLKPNERPAGWVAASELYRSGLAGPGFDWLKQEKPVARIGKTVSLYYFPPVP